ncbi:MAG: M48 family metallopeptidase [Micrococcus sp.]|nr:M48 family metallopeptidase [Micrococcus sp.]
MPDLPMPDRPLPASAPSSPALARRRPASSGRGLTRGARRRTTSAPARREEIEVVVDGVPVTIVRSSARTRTVSAAWREGRLRISVPAALSSNEEQQWVRRMIERAGPGPGTARPPASEAALMERVLRVHARYLPHVPAPASVAWSARQQRRWGSCTPATRAIRLARALEPMPEWVVDAVIVHELAHLQEAGHGAGFQALVARYPQYERAMAFLDGVTFAQGRGLDAEPPPSA